MPTGSESHTELSPSTVGIVWFDITFEEASDLPTEIDHDVTVSVPPGLPGLEEISSVAGNPRSTRSRRW